MTREPRHDDLRDRQFFRDQENMHRSGPAKSEQRKIARIKTAVNGYFTHRTGHLRNRDTQHTVRKLYRRPRAFTQPVSQVLERFFGQFPRKL